MVVKWDKTAHNEGFLRYDFTSKEVLVLEEEPVEVGKRAQGSGQSTTTITLVMVSVLFWVDHGQTDINAISCGYDGYRSLTVNLELDSGVALATLFDQDLL